MRVKIGPYRSWIGPYQIANAIFFWVNRRGIYADEPPIFSRWDYVAEEKFGDWLADREWLCNFLNWIDRKKKRTIEIKIDQWDTWSMDHTLALIVHPMLVQLKANNHGYFFSEPEDVPHIGKGEKDEHGSDKNEEARYEWIMDELIWTFASLANDDDSFYDDATGKYDYEASEKHNKRIENGLRLFGKYYRGLWD